MSGSLAHKTPEKEPWHHVIVAAWVLVTDFAGQEDQMQTTSYLRLHPQAAAFPGRRKLMTVVGIFHFGLGLELRPAMMPAPPARCTGSWHPGLSY